MTCFSLIIRKFMFFIRGISHATIEAADTENIERSLIEHGKALERATASVGNSSMANGKLRESIKLARSNVFADLHSLGEGVLRSVEGKRSK